MSQEVVTVPSAGNLPTEISSLSVGPTALPDPAPICDVINETLAHHNWSRGTYSPEVQRIFQKAWAVASHKRHRLVTVHHLAYALVFDDEVAGRELARHLKIEKIDGDDLALGCSLNILVLRAAEVPTLAPPPNKGALRWIDAGISSASKRKKKSPLQPEDLVAAIADGDLDYSSVIYPIRSAARVGYAHRGQISEVRSPAAPTSGFSGDIIKHLDSVEAQGAVSESSIDQTLLDMIFEELADQKTMIAAMDCSLRAHIEPISNVGGKVDGIGQQLGCFERSLKNVDRLIGRTSAIEQQVADVAVSVQHVGRINEMVATIDQRIAGLARGEQVGEIIGRLGRIDRRVTAIEQGLPRPPSGLRLAAAIGAVLAIGVAAGLLLTQWQSSSRPEVRTASIERSR